MYSYRALLRLELAVPEPLGEGALVELFDRTWGVVEILEDASGEDAGLAVLSPEPEEARELGGATVEATFQPPLV